MSNSVESAEFRRVLIGDSPRMTNLMRQVEKLGRTRWPVLIQGETGTGKELIARAIYNSHATGPFVVIDCSSIVGPLMESELFGYAKGAFTGAVQTKLGLIEAANGGTVFFDEVGELPLDLQVKLLRVLQEKEFRSVGAIAAKKVDFRVISATNRDLASEVDKGKFRQDLFYRLNVVTMRIPPLRERRDDIPSLVEHFIGKYGKSYSVSPELMAALCSYDWPGNVRELEHAIQRMLAVSSGPLLHEADLPSPIANAARAKRGPLGMPAGSPELDSAMTTSSADASVALHASGILPLLEVEKRAILEALRYTKGDRAMAAALLGIGRTTLYRKLKEYRMD